MTFQHKTFRPLFAFFASVAVFSFLSLTGCPAPSDKAGEDGKEPADAEAHDHDEDGHEHGEDGHEHGEEGHTHGDEEKGGDEEEAPADPGPKVDPEKDDVNAGEPEFPALPE